MMQDIFLICASVTLVVVSSTMIFLVVSLNKGLAALRDLSPVISDIRVISLNMAIASEGLAAGMQQVNRVTEVLGDIGDDIEQGRRVVKGTVETVSQLVSPWLTLLKLFQKK